MLKQITLGLFSLLVVGFLATGCGGADTAAQQEAAADVTASTPVTPTQPTAPVADAAPAGPTTAINFAETEFNFGKVMAGEKVSHTYTFTNTGNEPLIISNAKGSCGCTVPEWPREPIAVGGTGEVTVVFDSKNKKGPRNQKVTLTANTDPPQTFIYLKGEVEPDPNAPAAKTPNVQVQ